MAKKVITKEVLQSNISFKYGDQAYEESTSGHLDLIALTPLELKEALNRAPGKYAYWSSILADISKDLNDLEAKYKLWYAEVYLRVRSANDNKGTESFFEQTIYSQYAAKMQEYLRRKNDLVHARDKCKAIVAGYEIQSRTLQTIAGIYKQELGMINPRGAGNLEEQ